MAEFSFFSSSSRHWASFHTVRLTQQTPHAWVLVLGLTFLLWIPTFNLVDPKQSWRVWHKTFPNFPRKKQRSAEAVTFSYTSPYLLFPTGHLMVSPWLVIPPHQSGTSASYISLVDRNRCPTYILKALFQGLAATCFPPSATEWCNLIHLGPAMSWYKSSDGAWAVLIYPFALNNSFTL